MTKQDDQSKLRIRRMPHSEKNPYFLAVRDTAQDRHIGFRALGALFYLLSKPDDWEVRIPDLVRSDTKKAAVYRLINELREAGYIERTYERDNKGRITQVTYNVYEHPFLNIQKMDNQDIAEQKMDLQDVEKCNSIHNTDIGDAEQNTDDNKVDTSENTEKKESTPNTEPTNNDKILFPFSGQEVHSVNGQHANGKDANSPKGKPDTTAGVAADDEHTVAYTPEHMAAMKKKADEIVTAMAKSMEIE
jgi:predicted transcriptional regulator